jgi:hypothetical protein
MRLLSIALLALPLPACARTSSAPGDAAPAPVASPSPVAESPRPPIEAGPPRHRLTLACRAMAVQGSPTIAVDGGVKPLAASDPADGWITLGEKDTLTVTLPRTGRELTFIGPAFLEPCPGTDEAWLARGRFQGTRGSGESPGAEEWVVTPFGVLRYGAAIVEVTAYDVEFHASLKGGSATILAEGASAWQTLPPDAPRVVKGAPLGKTASAASAERCAKASAEAKALEDVLVLPDAAASPTFGYLAMRANDAHVLARAACAVAKLRADPANLAPATLAPATMAPPIKGSSEGVLPREPGPRTR